MSALLSRLAFGVGVALLALACVQLTSEPTEGAPDFEGMDVVICLDVSRSMLARDVAPNRLARAQAEIRALTEAAKGDRLGLVLFAGEARLLVPRTLDGASLAELADRVGPWDVSLGGTDLPAALDTARAALAGRPGPGAIVVLSDGEDLGGRDGTTVLAALRAEGLVVHTLGLGSGRGAKIPEGAGFVTDAAGREVVTALDPRALQGLARETGGTYVDVGAGDLASLYGDAMLPAARSAQAITARAGLRDTPAWLLLGALACLLVALGAPASGTRRALRAGAVLVGLLFVIPGCDGAGSADTSRATFLRGNAAFADSLALEQAAKEAPEADRGDLERAASRRAEDALAAWQWAAATRLDWPEARRNVERGLLRVLALRERRSDGSKPPPKRVPKADEPKKGEDDPGKNPPKPEPPPAQPEVPEDPPDDPTARIAGQELPEGRVLGILETLRLRERKKIELRKARRTVRPALGGRDW